MNFLYFITENNHELYDAICKVLARTTYKSDYIREEKKWLVKLNSTKRCKMPKSYFEYSCMDFEISDAEYWLEQEQYLKIMSMFSSPILHNIDYYMIETIEVFLDDLSRMSPQNEIYFGDELSDDFLIFSEFSVKWKKKKMFFWWEN